MLLQPLGFSVGLLLLLLLPFGVGSILPLNRGQVAQVAQKCCYVVVRLYVVQPISF